MSGQLRTLKNRIRSVTNTQKITRAMEMVAASKLRRYQTMMVNGKDYAEGLESLLKRLGQAESEFSHPFLEQREEKRVGLLLFTSDTGLCGSYNLDLIATGSQFLKSRSHQSPVLIGFGKMGINTLKRAGFSCSKTYSDIRASQTEETVKNLKGYLEELYLSEKVDAIYVIYSHFLSLSSYKPVVQKLLPLEKIAGPETASDDYILEPDRKTVLQRLIPEFFEARTRQIFLESFVSEQIARMQAMHQATENAKEMIDSLVLLRNKVRQAAITKEIIEIVSGSQALKN